MGLLSSILKGVKRDVEKAASDAIYKSVSNAATNAINNSQARPTSVPAKGQTPDNTVSGDMYINGFNYTQRFQTPVEHFRPIIRNNFSDYEVLENVMAREIDPSASTAFKNFDYALKKAGRIVAVIAIIPTGKAASQKAAKLCAKNNVKYIRFYCSYENTEAYVVQHIRKFLA